MENNPTRCSLAEPRTSWGESCNASPSPGCCWSVKSLFFLSPRAGFSPAELGREELPGITGNKRWEGPRQSSANSPDKIVPQIPKAGLGLSNLPPKTAPASIPEAAAAALIPRNRQLCSRICHSDLQQQHPREGGRRGLGGSQPQGAAPCSCTAQPDPKKPSRAGCGPAWLLSTGKESLVLSDMI